MAGNVWNRWKERPLTQTHIPAPWTAFSVWPLENWPSLIQELIACPSGCKMHVTRSCLVLSSQTLLFSHITLLNSFTVQNSSPINKELFFFCPRAKSTYSMRLVEGFSPLYKTNKADFAVIKFYKVMLTLSWCVLLQTALLINYSQVLTFPDINNAAAPWSKRERSEWPGL